MNTIATINWTNIASTWWTRELTPTEGAIGIILIIAYLVFIIIELFVKKDKNNV